MRIRLLSRIARRGFGLSTCFLLALLSACADVAASLPARPTPVATLARLPSVTPVTPRPTPPPTETPVAETTPTVAPLTGTVNIGANVRSGPGVEFAIVGVLAEGDVVALEGRQGTWYLVRVGELNGWMSGQVLTIDPELNAAVPEARP
jgi:uncharacterized protein YgiM (DUF1202 family)